MLAQNSQSASADQNYDTMIVQLESLPENERLRRVTAMVSGGEVPGHEVELFVQWAMRLACAANDLELVVMLTETYHPTTRAIQACDALECACEGKSLRIIKWLMAHFELSGNDVRYRAGYEADYLLSLVVSLGCTDIVEWIVETFGISIEDVNKVYDETCGELDWDDADALGPTNWLLNKFGSDLTHKFHEYARFQYECQNPDFVAPQLAALRGVDTLDECKQIIHDHKISRNEIIDHSIMSFAAANGKLDVAKWLTREYSLDIEDIRVDDNQAIRHAAMDEHFEVVRWAIDEFDLTVDDIRAGETQVFVSACTSGELELAKWLVAKFGLTAADVRVRDNIALRLSCARNDWDVAEWLIGTFNLTAADAGDAKSELDLAVRMDMEINEPVAISRLTQKFGAANLNPLYAERLAEPMLPSRGG
jgi:hypothetical protein